MSERFETLFQGGTVVTESGIGRADVGLRDGRIAAVGQLHASQAGDVVDCTGLHVLPGVIDTQVHFREPGSEHKEDLAHGSRAAVLGGVTAVFEMPNTKPLTDTEAALQDKLDRAKGRMWCDHAFYIGATPDNIDALPELERLPGACGVKIFMGSSTGDLLIADDSTLLNIFKRIKRRAAVHAEDEPRLLERKHIADAAGDARAHPEWRDVETALNATRRVLKTVVETGSRVHVLHITTADEIKLLARHRRHASVEVTPQHLTLAAPDCYQDMGSRAQMNPPIRDAGEQKGLWWGVQQGIVDVVGSDHAPHTLEEKAAPYPQSPSGMPGVQTLTPIMLDHVANGRLSLSRFVDLTSAGAARLFGLAGKGRLGVGMDADLTVVDLKARRRLADEDMATRSGWTPYHGKMVTGFPIMTVIRGRTVMREQTLLGEAGGQPIAFQETLQGVA